MFAGCMKQASLSMRLQRSLWSVGLVAMTSVIGCNDAIEPPAGPKTGREVLERTAAAYQKAMTYADGGEVRFRFKDGDSEFDETYPWSVSFARPNKLRMHVYGAIVVCDGKDFFATLADVPGQVLKKTAPAVLSQEVIYENPTLYDQMLQRVAGGSVPLMFLLDSNALNLLLFETGEPTLLDAEPIDDISCYRVKIPRKDGDLIFWVEQRGYEIRRIELPLKDLAEHLRQDGVKVSDLSVVADLKGATLGAKVDDVAFRFDAPSEARIVQDFALMPQPLPPSRLLGTKIGDFRFETLNGEEVTRESLAGKAVVLDFWATWCVPCFQTLPEMQRVYERFKDDDRVRFMAVSIDRAPTISSGVKAVDGGAVADVPAVENAVVRDAFVKAKLSIPIVRDLAQQANTVFEVEQIPNLFILGPDGTVEDHELGANAELAAQLPGRLERLLAGGSLVKEARARYDDRLRRYEAQFQNSAGVGGSADGSPVAAQGEPNLQRGTIAPATKPEKLTISRVWSSTNVDQPGNIVVLGEGNDTRILVVEKLTSVVELDSQGNVVARHALDLPKSPEDGIVAFLRTAVDTSGQRWYVGAASSRQQLHVFDSQWQRKFSYPEATSAAGIADVELGDLDGDGQIDINVGYYDVVGVQSVGLDGRRKWSNRALANVISLAVTGRDNEGHRNLWCAHERGTIVPIDYHGRELPPLPVGGQFIRLIKAAGPDGERQYLAIATTGPGADTALGLDDQARPRWSMALPPGLQPIPSVDMVAHGDLAGTGVMQWVILGSDASLNVVAIDGTIVDRWNYGSAVSGFAVASGRRLVVATAQGVEMWQVE
jgi:thiol-disulfide isomerase/thioredoxin/outer membrane lipoprotein-sorting protein